MILECPSCQNRYLVDPRALGARGRTVRCARCKNQWFAEPEQDELADDVLSVEDVAEQHIPPIPQGSSVPAFPRQRPAPLSLRLATGGLAVLCAVVALIYFQPSLVRSIPALASAYAAFGIYNTDGVVLAGLEYEKSQPAGATSLKDNHTIKGYLVNTASQPRQMPRLRLTLQGRDGALLRRKTLTDNSMLAPGESKHFVQTLPTSPESLRHVIIEHGSPFELKLR
jgi:predicted Zn finger-like uncharacterized protein